MVGEGVGVVAAAVHFVNVECRASHTLELYYALAAQGDDGPQEHRVFRSYGQWWESCRWAYQHNANDM